MVIQGEDIESGKVLRSVPHWRIVYDQALVTPEVMRWEYEGSGTEDDPYIVDWIENDPRNPMLFPVWKKWAITINAFAPDASSEP